MKMTREERELRKLILTAGCFYHHPERHPEIMKAIGAMRRAVIQQERERCALKIDDLLRRAANCGIGMPRTDIIAAIRKGTK